MRSCKPRPGTAPLPQAAPFWIALTLVLGAGCSANRLPLAPESPTGTRVSHDGAVVASGRCKEQVVVTLGGGVDAATLATDYGATLAHGSGWRVASLLPGDSETSEALILRLVTDSRVLTAEKDAAVETAESRQQSFAFDDGYGSPQACATQPALAGLGLTLAHQFTTGGGVKVAILDTGAELAHPALAGRIAAGYDFVDDDSDPTELGNRIDEDADGIVDEALGHGTHVAGIVSLVAPGAQLLIARVLNDDGQGDMLAVARGVRWAVANGARVINLSLGGLGRSDAVQLALEEASNAGVVCVAAAGNWGSLVPEEFPATSRYAVAVAAVSADGVAAPFTSYGDYVDLCAPGVSIRSAYVNGGYALWNGTSMATPLVSGGAALVAALHSAWAPNKVVDRLLVTARGIYPLNPTYETYLGAGALDLGAALWAETAIEDGTEAVADR